MKSKAKTQQTNTHEYLQPPTSTQQAAFDQNINTAYDTPDASIPYTFGNMREGLTNQFDSLYGGDYSPEVKDAKLYAGNQAIDQMQGGAIRDDNMRRKQAKTGLLGQSAGLMAPNLVQSGGTSTTTSSPALGPMLISAGAGLGSAALGKPRG